MSKRTPSQSASDYVRPHNSRAQRHNPLRTVRSWRTPFAVLGPIPPLKPSARELPWLAPEVFNVNVESTPRPHHRIRTGATSPINGAQSHSTAPFNFKFKGARRA